MLSEQNPDEVMDLENSGSDTTRRYLYQAAYAALQSVLMIDEKSEYKEIFCEQQEDILIKLIDDSFIGIQVKSQDEIHGGFKFGDERILNAIKRFIEHEIAFPNKFKRYILCTNCGFLNRGDSSDFLYCLNLLRKWDGDLEACYRETNFSKHLKKILELSNVKDISLIIKVLNKTITVRWASLRDYKKVLTAETAFLLKAENQPQSILKKTSDMLIDKALHAAEFSDKQTQRAYHDWINNPEGAITTEIINKKRITKKMVTETILNCMNPTGLLQGIMPISVLDLPHGINILTQKLDEGKVSRTDVDMIKDCDNSALRLLLEWYDAYGKEEADARFDHLRIIVQHECLDSYSGAYNPETPFGQKMLGLVRERLRQRKDEISRRYSDCCYEHLEGIAGILSEKCTVWWSKEFKLNEVT